MGDKDGKTCRSLLTRGKAYQAANAVVRMAMDNGQFAKILVERDEDSTLRMSVSQNGIVAGVVRPVSCPINVVACGTERIGGLTPNARVEQ